MNENIVIVQVKVIVPPDMIQFKIFLFIFLLDSRYIIVVEHDLSVLDYLSDFICCLYGIPGVYGVVTMPFTVREGKKEIAVFVIIRLKKLKKPPIDVTNL